MKKVEKGILRGGRGIPKRLNHTEGRVPNVWPICCGESAIMALSAGSSGGTLHHPKVDWGYIGVMEKKMETTIL